MTLTVYLAYITSKGCISNHTAKYFMQKASYMQAKLIADTIKTQRPRSAAASVCSPQPEQPGPAYTIIRQRRPGSVRLLCRYSMASLLRNKIALYDSRSREISSQGNSFPEKSSRLLTSSRPMAAGLEKGWNNAD